MRPTLLLKFAEAVDCYQSWRRADRPTQVGAAHISVDTTIAIRQVLAEAIPEPIGAQDPAAALDRAINRGAFATPTDTGELLRQLGAALIPAPLIDELVGATQRPLLRIQPSSSLASVPWALLQVGPERRMLGEIADVHYGVPAAIAATALPPSQASSAAVVAVIDPRVPGSTATSPLGSVLGKPSANDLLAQLLGGQVLPAASTISELVRRTDLDRHWLYQNCRGAARLLYVGHVSAAGEDTALHLCCADSNGEHVPLRVSDLLGDQGWQLPPRVAIIGCGSGTDMRYPEPMGMSLAMVLRGAQLVTATLWTLPTEAGLGICGADLADRKPLREMIIAVDRAQQSADPVAALLAWQQQRAKAWFQHGHPADSPLLWGSVITMTREGATK